MQFVLALLSLLAGSAGIGVVEKLLARKGAQALGGTIASGATKLGSKIPGLAATAALKLPKGRTVGSLAKSGSRFVGGTAKVVGGFALGDAALNAGLGAIGLDQTEDEIAQAPQQQLFIEPSQQSQLGQIQQEAALRQALEQFGISLDDLVENADNLGATGGLF